MFGGVKLHSGSDRDRQRPAVTARRPYWRRGNVVGGVATLTPGWLSSLYACFTRKTSPFCTQTRLFLSPLFKSVVVFIHRLVLLVPRDTFFGRKR